MLICPDVTLNSQCDAIKLKAIVWVRDSTFYSFAVVESFGVSAIAKGTVVVTCSLHISAVCPNLCYSF